MARKPDPAAALEQARATLKQIEGSIAEVTGKRRARLLAGDDASAIAELDQHIEKLKHAAQTERDRTALLEAEVERLAGERRAREHQTLIERNERKFGERDAAGAKLATAIAEVDRAFRECVAIGRSLDAAWPWPSHDRPAVMVTPGSLLLALSHELYRIGSRPQLFGGQDTIDAGLHLPGAKSPRIEWIGQPEKVPSLVAVLADATRYASEIMRGGTVAVQPSAAASQANGSPTNGAQPNRLAELLKRQNELAADPARENEYMQVVQEIAELSAGA